MGLPLLAADWFGEVLAQDKARQKEMSGLREINREYVRRRSSDQYKAPYKISVVLTLLGCVAGYLTWMNEWSIVTSVLGVMGMFAVLLIVLSLVSLLIEDRWIVRDMKREGWPLPPK